MAKKPTLQEETELEHARLKYDSALHFKAIEAPFVGLIGDLQNAIASWNEHQGFWPLTADVVTTKLSKAALIHSEISELVEAVRKPMMKGALAKDGIPLETEELADAVIRILDYAGYYQLDLAEAIIRKLELNLERPFRHGKEA